MFEIIIAIALLGGLGLIFGLVLSAASKVFYVETDPRLDQLNACLPGANCGGCGYAGCGAYAEAVLNGTAPIGACASGGNECAQAMAAIMGIEAVSVTRKVALVRCSGERTYDKDGNPCPTASNLVSFSAEGAGRIFGTDNGDQRETSGFFNPSRKLLNGACVAALISAKDKTGKLTLRAESEGLVGASIEIDVK